MWNKKQIRNDDKIGMKKKWMSTAYTLIVWKKKLFTGNL